MVTKHSYCFSFYNDIKIFINDSAYKEIYEAINSIVNEDDFFIVIDNADLNKWRIYVQNQLVLLLDTYVLPEPIKFPKFEHRYEIKIFDNIMILDPKNEHHFRIIQVNDILVNVIKSIHSKKNVCLVSRRDLILTGKIDLIYSILNKVSFYGEVTLEKMYNELLADSKGAISLFSFKEITNKLIFYKILSGPIPISKGQYFSFFA